MFNSKARKLWHMHSCAIRVRRAECIVGRAMTYSWAVPVIAHHARIRQQAYKANEKGDKSIEHIDSLLTQYM
jgi:hypothetical protein